MKNLRIKRTAFALLCGACVLAATTGSGAPKAITLYAKVVYLDPLSGITSASPGAGLIPMWGFTTNVAGPAEIPGTQIDVGPAEYADGLQITVFNQLPEPVSVVIPNLSGSTDPGNPALFSGDPDFGNRIRSLVPEVPPGGSRVYTWSGPLAPGTYVYHSGSHPGLQVQMGLYGMVTIRQTAAEAYPGILRSTEVPVVFSEIDPVLHWAVHTNDYGPGKTISSTIHSKPSYFLINGRAHNSVTPPPALTQDGQVGQPTLLRLINVCWKSRIPMLGGPFPAAGGNYLTVVAEDGKPYPYARQSYALELAAMKTKDAIITPTEAGSYRLYDRMLGLANDNQPNGGMLRSWTVATGGAGTPALVVSPASLNFVATAGGASPASQNLGIVNGGGGTLNWTASVTAGAPWLSAVPPSGAGNGSVTVSVNSAGLVAGLYNGTIQVNASGGASGSPQSVNVSLQVNAGATPTVGIASFNGQSGFNTTTHNLTGVPAGAVLVLTTGARAAAANQNATISSSPGLTWTKRSDALGASSGGFLATRANAEIYTAVFPAGGNVAVSSSWGALTAQSSTCYVVTNSEPVLGGASAVALDQSAPSVAIITTRANSILFCASMDRNAQTGTPTYRDSANQALRAAQLGATSYHYYKQAPVVGARTEGLSAPTGQNAVTAVLEIRSP